MKSLTMRTNRSGWSLCGKWPAFEITSTRAPGARAEARAAWLAGMTRSSSPQITHSGIASVRYARSAIVTIWPRQSTTARVTWQMAERASKSLNVS